MTALRTPRPAARTEPAAGPQVQLTGEPLADVAGADVLAVPVRAGAEGPVPGAGAQDLARGYGLDLDAHLALDEAKGEVGEVVSVPLPAGAHGVRRVLLVGVGDGSPLSLRRAGAALGRRVKGSSRLATTVADGVGDEGLRAFVEGLALASYSFSRRSTDGDADASGAGGGGESKRKRPVERVDLVDGRPDARREPLEHALITAAAARLARDLANTPSNEKTPAWLAEQARLAGRAGGVAVRVRDERELAQEGFGGIVAVGMGSANPPRLIEMTYAPEGAGRRTPHVVLVGKGITFDSGGLSLKERDPMVAMKTDMAAGGAVIAVMGALRDLRCRVRVTGLVAAAENMPSGSAQRPGDVITHYGGRTVEVFNTDAEGRLVLADALAYADLRLAPDLLVDLATLTGAASLGLGRRHGALYATDEALAAALVAAGDASGERLWRMPLVDDYRDSLDSAVADLANIGRRYQGGSIVAALFLREFVGGRRWAHLDIAGPARAEGDEHEVTKGATGFGVRLLLRWLEQRVPYPLPAR